MFAVTSPAQLDEAAAVLALAAATEGPWHRTASLIEDAGSAVRILDRDWSGFELLAEGELAALVDRVTPAEVDRYRAVIEGQQAAGVRVVTVLDQDYPVNLRQIFNRPPFLFVQGALQEQDATSIAVVGTRKASERGLELARLISARLAGRGITVLSGMARGIDAAAHGAALTALGRTIAVVGTGIDRVYPPEHGALAREIVASGGALVSQFMPGSGPTRFSFPMRNAVMSGMAIGTVVVEASATSGARLQARLALEHGKRLFLVRPLVLEQEWAQRYSQRPGVRVVDSVAEILQAVAEGVVPPAQLTLR
jgi:DNA processing protein